MLTVTGDPTTALDASATTGAAGEDASPYRLLRVAEVIAETADAISIVFDAPAADADFAYRPGQFLTLRLDLPGGALSRCYSLASAPGLDPRMKITVKRVASGLGSNWLCDHVQAGSELAVLPPAGVFGPRRFDEDLLLIAGGSGITPVIAILKAALAEGRSITLLYANRDERSVIFRDELDRLTRDHPGRLVVQHWLESVQGLPDPAVIAPMLTAYANREAYICGPDLFMQAATAALTNLGVERNRIHLEKFVSLSGDPAAGSVSVAADESNGVASEVVVSLDGETRRLTWPAGRMLLDVMLDAGMRAPYSCREGKCSACSCKVVQGEVVMLENGVLEDSDLAQGWVLSCQTQPLSAQVEITFD